MVVVALPAGPGLGGYRGRDLSRWLPLSEPDTELDRSHGRPVEEPGVDRRHDLVARHDRAPIRVSSSV